jgi:cyclase
MLAKRLIARLDVKGENLIKGINLEGLRVLGHPNDFALRYYEAGIDEILYMDAVASLYDRNSLKELISVATRDIFVPLTVGGGIRTVQDAQSVLRSGADKVALNTAAIGTPGIISELADKFGNQCVVVSIEAKRNPRGGWEAYIENGRQPTGIEVCDWAVKAEELGAGEILLTSIDQEGTRKGMDLKLISSITTNVSIPVIASGGVGNPTHTVEGLRAGADAVAVADCLHYNRFDIAKFKELAIDQGFRMREYEKE